MSRRSLALGAVSFVLAALLAEAVVRLAAPVAYWAPIAPRGEDAWFETLHRPSPVEGLAYELTPDARWRLWGGIPVLTNSLGMRDDEPRPPDARVRRVVVLGDSVTFGSRVAGDDTYPNMLEPLLDEATRGSGITHEVFNLGVSGYSTRDEALVLRHKAAALRPDLIVVGYVFNDPEIDPIQPLHAHFHPAEWWQSSHLLRLGARWLHRRAVRELGDGSETRYLHHDPRKWGSVVSALEDMAAFAGADHIPCVLVIFPSIPGVEASWDDYRYTDIHERVGAAGRQAGFGVLDLLDTYSEHAPVRLRVLPKDGHPSPFGHALAAKALAEFLAEHQERWLRAPR